MYIAYNNNNKPRSTIAKSDYAEYKTGILPVEIKELYFLEMKNNKIINNLSKKISVTNTEFIVIFTFAIGLVIGVVYKIALKEIIHYPVLIANNDAFLLTLDSIAEVHKTTFVGSNIENEPVAELAAKDTIVKKIKVKKTDFKGVININTASKTQLMQLYRIGEKSADKIIEYRTKKPFTSKEDIMKVKGIGEKTFEKIKDNIAV